MISGMLIILIVHQCSKKSCYIPRFQISKISQKNEIALVTKLFFSFNWGRGEGKEHSNFKIKFPCSFQLIFPFKPNYHHTTDFELLTKATMATFSLHQKHNWDSMRDSHTSHHPVTRSHSRSMAYYKSSHEISII